MISVFVSMVSPFYLNGALGVCSFVNTARRA